MSEQSVLLRVLYSLVSIVLLIPSLSVADESDWPAQQIVTIAPSEDITLDTSPPPLKGLVIQGTLRLADTDLQLRTGWIKVDGGHLIIGTKEQPITSNIELIIDGPVEAQTMSMGEMTHALGGRFIVVMHGGKIDIHGDSAQKVSWTKLAEDISPGQTTFRLAEAVNWERGDKLSIAPSGYVAHEAEKVTVSSVSSDGKTVTIEPTVEGWEPYEYTIEREGKRDRTATKYRRTSGTNGFRYTHLGLQQTIDNRTIDMRAEVGLLTRNIIIRSPEDIDRWGFHIMMMGGPSNQLRMEGVELIRGGQTGLQGRYPIHWHNPITSIGRNKFKEPADISNQYIRNNSIHTSLQRGIVTHGTRNAKIRDNVLYDILDSAFVFSEDGHEYDNKFYNNLVTLVRVKESEEFAFPVTGHHKSSQAEPRPACFWGRNPNQTFIGNVCAGNANGSGFMFDTREFQTRNMRPFLENKVTLVFRDNTAHSFYAHNGKLTNPLYEPQTRGIGLFVMTYNDNRNDPFHFEGLTVYKALNMGVWIENQNHILSNAIIADSPISVLPVGATVRDSLLVGQSDNLVGGSTPEKHGVFELGAGIHMAVPDHRTKELPQVYRVTFAHFSNAAITLFNRALEAYEPSNTQSTTEDVTLINTPLAFKNLGQSSVHGSSKNAALWDRDGSLFGFPAVGTIERLSSTSQYNEAMDMYLTPVAADEMPERPGGDDETNPEEDDDSGTNSVVAMDYDGDGISDPAVYRATTGHFYVAQSKDGNKQVRWGGSGFIPLYADIDGDGRTDYGLATIIGQGLFFWFYESSTHALISTPHPLGSIGDQIVIEDYDGDGKDDLAIYNPTTDEWRVRSYNGEITSYTFGDPAQQERAVPADYDGDGKADYAVWDQGAYWLIERSSTKQILYQQWGLPWYGDIPLAGIDIDNDNRADFSVCRMGTTPGIDIFSASLLPEPGAGGCYVLSSSTNITYSLWVTPGLTLAAHNPYVGDEFISGDYNGDGIQDIGIYRGQSAEWYINFRDGNGPVRHMQWGWPGDSIARSNR